MLQSILLAPTSTLANGCGGGSNIKICSDRYLCTLASYSAFRYSQRAREEIQSRGLSCDKIKLVTSTPKPKTTVSQVRRSLMHTSFSSLNVSKRKKIQSVLLSLEMYTSNIDGLYGKGTATALRAYNKEYLGDVSLSKKANVEALFDNILTRLPRDIISVAAAKVEPEVSPLTFTDALTPYNNKDYATALKALEILVITGNADAQNLLGKMYAEGLGTLQINKTAHMWFNIAALNGNTEASSLRNTLAETMTASAVEQAQDLALKCIQSEYTECGLSTTPGQTPKKPPTVVVAGLTGATISNDFKSQPVLQRKQLQYALKKLSVYKSSIDGLWGKGTLAAFDAYLEQTTKDFDNPAELFNHLIHESNAPNSFPENKLVPRKTTPAPKETTPDYRNTGRGGWQPLSGNPKISYDDAKSICEPRAIAEGRYFQRTGRTRGGGTYSCTKYGFNNVSCRESNGGGYASGILKGLEEAMSQRDAQKVYEATAKACMAEYGWIKR